MRFLPLAANCPTVPFGHWPIAGLGMVIAMWALHCFALHLVLHCIVLHCTLYCTAPGQGWPIALQLQSWMGIAKRGRPQARWSPLFPLYTSILFPLSLSSQTIVREGRLKRETVKWPLWGTAQLSRDSLVAKYKKLSIWELALIYNWPVNYLLNMCPNLSGSCLRTGV